MNVYLQRLRYLLNLRKSDAREPRTPIQVAANQGMHIALSAYLTIQIGASGAVPAAACALLGWAIWEVVQVVRDWADRWAVARDGLRDMAAYVIGAAAPVLHAHGPWALLAWFMVAAAYVAALAALHGRVPGETGNV